VRRALALAVIFVCLFATPAAAKRRAPVGQRGCRFLAYSYDPLYRPSAQIELASIAMMDFKLVGDDPALDAIMDVRGPYPARNTDLAAWCKQHYPNDREVRHANWPTT
jgi:hypothetical protein